MKAKESWHTAQRVCLMLLRVYQGTGGIFPRPGCRFWPTCSHYAYEAIERHGMKRGIFLGLRRLLRCRPAGGHGFDPVPEKEFH